MCCSPSPKGWTASLKDCFISVLEFVCGSGSKPGQRCTGYTNAGLQLKLHDQLKQRLHFTAGRKQYWVCEVTVTADGG